MVLIRAFVITFEIFPFVYDFQLKSFQFAICIKKNFVADQISLESSCKIIEVLFMHFSSIARISQWMKLISLAYYASSFNFSTIWVEVSSNN